MKNEQSINEKKILVTKKTQKEKNINEYTLRFISLN